VTAAAAADAEPPALAALRRGLAWLGRVELTLAVVAFAAVAALAIWQVILRYGFAGSIWWAQEVSQLAMLVAYFLGIAYVAKANQDIVVQFVVAGLPRRWRLRLYVAIQALIVAFCLVVAVTGALLAPQQLRFRTYILNIPRFYSTLPLILASLSMAATAAYFCLAAWRRRDEDADLDRVEEELTILRVTSGAA
jgi:TRAP-type C4-dicarboxylate transport system permease small subunit